MRVCAFDLSACFWTAVHATAGQHVDAAFDRTVGRVVAFAEHFDRMLVCVDSYPSFRKELDAGYKANRPAKEEAQLAQLTRVIASLKGRGFRLLSTPNYEADDIIATVAKWVRESGHELTIAGSDKDLYQLVGGPVRMHLLSTDTVLDEAGIEAKIGVPPSLVRDYLALVGDAADNVKGIPGVGPKRAVELLKKYGSLDEVVRQADSIEWPSVKKALLENLGVLDLAVRLVTLKDDAPIFKTSASAAATPEPHREEAVAASRPAEAAEEPGTLSEVASPSPGFPSSRAEASERPGNSIAVEVERARAALEALPAVPDPFVAATTPREVPLEEVQFESSIIKASPQIAELAAALAKAQGAIEHAKKDSVNPQFAKGAGSGRYADLASVWSACRAALSSNGLAVIQSVRLVDKTQPRHRLTTMLLHSSGQWLSSECGVLARDDTPQGFGSALTYARRYTLAALVGVAQDDDDAEAAHGRGRAA